MEDIDHKSIGLPNKHNTTLPEAKMSPVRLDVFIGALIQSVSLHFAYTRFAYTHFAYHHFAYTHFAYIHFAYIHFAYIHFAYIHFAY
jgi:hypothetical protein